MLAAGTGIAPMIPVIRTVLDNEEDETFITLLYGCKRYADVLCKKQLDEWQQYWNFKCLYALSKVNQLWYNTKKLESTLRVKEHVYSKHRIRR